MTCHMRYHYDMSWHIDAFAQCTLSSVGAHKLVRVLAVCVYLLGVRVR